MEIQPYCPGVDCALRRSCAHYKEEIDMRLDLFFSRTPYDRRKENCEFYIGPADDELVRQVKNLFDGSKNSE